MAFSDVIKRPLTSLSRFRRKEDGNTTIEAALWLPFFFFLLVGVGQFAMIFHGQFTLQTLAQNATRAYSVGQIGSEAGVVSYIKTQMSSVSQNVTVKCTVTDGVIRTIVVVPAGDFGGPLNLFPDLARLEVGAIAEQLMEV